MALRFENRILRFSVRDSRGRIRPADVDADTPTKKAAWRTLFGIGVGGGGLNQSEVDARVMALVKGYARERGRGITTDDLDTALRNTVNEAVAAGSVETTDDALTMESGGGTAVTIDKADLALGTVTQQAAEAGTSDIRASWTPERVKQAIEALVTQQLVRGLIDASFVQGLQGQVVTDTTGSAGQLHVSKRDADGNETVSTITLGDGAGATQAHTDVQITNLAGALVASVMPFTYDPATQTLTYTQPPIVDGSVTSQKLAAEVQTLIDSKIAEDAVEEAAQVGAITDPVAQAFREKIGAATAASHQANPLEYETRLGAFAAPQSATTQWYVTPLVLPDSADTLLLTDGSGKVLVDVPTNTRTSVRVADILAQAEVSQGQRATADGLRVVVRFPGNFDDPEPNRSADDTTYYLSHNGRNLAIAPDDIGDFNGVVFVNGSRLYPFADREVTANEPGYKVPVDKIDPPTYDRLPARLTNNLASVARHEAEFEEAVIDSVWTTDVVVSNATSTFASGIWLMVSTEINFDTGHHYYELHAFDVAGNEADTVFFTPDSIPLAGGAVEGAAVTADFYRHVITFDGDEGTTAQSVYIGRNLANEWLLAFDEAGDHRYSIEAHDGEPYTMAEKDKLAAISEGATRNTLTNVPVAAPSTQDTEREILVITPGPRQDAAIELVLDGNQRRFGLGLGSVVNNQGRTDFTTHFVAIEFNPLTRVITLWTLPSSQSEYIEWDQLVFNAITLNFAAGTEGVGAVPWDATSPQPSYRRITFPAIPAEDVPDEWDTVPVNLKDDQGETALQADDGISKQWLVGSPRRTVERLTSGVLRTPVERASYLTDQTTGDFSVSPAAADRPEGWLIELTDLLFANFGGEYVEVALSRNVVQKSEEAFPAKLIATPAESANARVQAEIHRGGDRDDQLLRFPAFLDPVVRPSALFPNPTRTTGTTHALTPPPGWRRVTYYSDTHNSQNYAGRLVLLPTGDVVREFAPVQIALRVVGETEAQGTTIALNRDIHGVYVSNVLAAKYRPRKIDGANPPPQPDVSLLANPQNGSSDGGNFQYRNPVTAENKYFDESNMGSLAKPRRLFFANAAFFTALRAVGSNVWMEFSASTGHTALFPREDLPDGSMFFFRLKAGTSTGVLNGPLISVTDFKALPNIAASNTAPLASQEVLSGASNAATVSPNSYTATLTGEDTTWIGWRNDRFAFRVDHADRWLDASSIFEIWVLGG